MGSVYVETVPSWASVEFRGDSVAREEYLPGIGWDVFDSACLIATINGDDHYCFVLVGFCGVEFDVMNLRTGEVFRVNFDEYLNGQRHVEED